MRYQLEQIYEELKQQAGGSVWAQRCLGELNFLRQVLLEEDGLIPPPVCEAAEALLQQVREDGALTRPLCLQWEAAMENYSPRCKAYALICAGHAHMDMNWMWGTEETTGVVIDTFQTMLNLMEEYPDFCFSQSQASAYEIIETCCPSMLPQIRKRVHEGRWEVTASTWVEADQNMPNTESVLNHLRETKTYLSKLLDLDPGSLDLDFEPDTFGHSAHLPALLQAGGVRYFYYCRGYDRRQLFRWRAPSGEEVLAYCEPAWYNGTIDYDMAAYLPHWSKVNGLKTGLKLYGVGDHGGGATRKDLECLLQLQQCPLLPRVQFGRIHDFLQQADQVRSSLPVVERELNFIFPGCYTTQSRIKLANRHGEDHLHDTQALTAMSMLAGCEDPHPGCFSKAWRKLLFNQFHDILPGSCIRESREAALGSAQEAGSLSLGAANRAMRNLGQKIDTSLFGILTDPTDTAEGAGVGLDTVKGSSLERYASASSFRVTSVSRSGGRLRAYTIYNPTQYDRSEPVELTLWDWPLALTQTDILDGSRQPVQFQPTAEDQAYWAHTFHRILIPVRVPAFGYANYYVMPSEKPRKPIVVETDPREIQRGDEDYVLENSRIRAVLSAVTLQIKSITDKQTGQALLSGPATFRLVQETTDWMSAWVIGAYEQVTDLQATCPVHVTDYDLTGLVRHVTWELRFGRSYLKARISLAGESDTLRLTLDTDFQEVGDDKHVPQLQFYVPYAYGPETIRCDVPGGELDRPQLSHDVPVLRYLCPVPRSGSGLVLTSDCKYGYRAWDQTVSITLLRSSIWPDPYPEQGIHQIELGIAVTTDHSRPALRRIGTVFSHGLYPYSNSLHQGQLPQSSSLLQVEGGEVVVLRPGREPHTVFMAAQRDTASPCSISRPHTPCDLQETTTASADQLHSFYLLKP